MLAAAKTFPGNPPPGFSQVTGEPKFDPSRHLALEPPDEVMILEDFGYSPKQSAQFASPIAAVSPVRFLSQEGIAATQHVLELLQPRIVTYPEGGPSGGCRRIYFGEYQSQFLRDLVGCREVTDYLSEIFQTPIAAHTMGHLGCQINFGNEKVGGVVSDWHRDIVGFTVVLSMHDASQLDGGHFVYFKGPRDEGQRLLDAGQPLPHDRLVVANQAPIGYATIMQGTAILHGAQPMRRTGFRCNIINSYVSRDVTAPDPNHGFLVRDFYLGSPMNPLYTEMARHAAWLGQAKLGTIFESLPWTEDRAQIITALSSAVEDVERCIKQLEAGDVSVEQYEALYVKEDERQMTTQLFSPGAVASRDG